MIRRASETAVLVGAPDGIDVSGERAGRAIIGGDPLFIIGGARAQLNRLGPGFTAIGRFIGKHTQPGDIVLV